MDMGIMSAAKSYRYEYYNSQVNKTKNGDFSNSVNELFGKRGADAPYGYLAENGVINYRGAVFVCDEKRNSLCIGDVSDPKKCLNIPLSNGGNLIVNRDNIGQLKEAISMFTPEDISRIMRAIAEDTKSRQVKNDIEEEKCETINEIADNAVGRTDEDGNIKASDIEKTSNDEREDDYDTDISASDSEAVDYMQEVKKKIEEIYRKLINGNTEVSYQIGGQNLTEKEWDMLISRLDNALDELRKLAEEEKQATFDDRKAALRELTEESYISREWKNFIK